MTFSVIIPEYKQLCYLDKVHIAWMAQTFKDFELIVTADEDDPAVTEWCNLKKVKYIHQTENTGNYAKVVNAGAFMADGEYLFICNADSYPEPDCLERLAKAIDPNKLVSAIRVNVDQEGKIVSPDWRLDRIILEHEADVVDIFNPNPWQYMTGNGVVIPTKIFRDMGGYYEGYGKGRQDWDFFFHAEANGVGMAWCPQAKINHIYHGDWTDNKEDLELFQKRWDELQNAKWERQDRIEDKKDIIFSEERAKEKEKLRREHIKEIEENERKMAEEDKNL